MALLNRFSKLNDRGETGIFTFIVTKSVTRDFHRDATTKDFCFGYHRWAISFQRPSEKVLGVHLLLRNPSPNTACVVDFSLTLLNRRHFSHNQVYSKRQAKFTITNPMQGVSRWIQMSELIERRFSDETGEFLFELSLSNMTTIFECDIQLNPATLTQYKGMLKGTNGPPAQQRPQQRSSLTSNGQPGGGRQQANSTNKRASNSELINLETNYFTFGSFDWSLTIVPLVVPSQQATRPSQPQLLSPQKQNSSSSLSISSITSASASSQQQASYSQPKLEPVCRVYLNRLNGFDSLCRVRYRVILGHHQTGGQQSAEFVDSKLLDQISDSDGRIRGHQFKGTNILKLISLRSAANTTGGQQTANNQRASSGGLHQSLQQQQLGQANQNLSLDLRVHIEMLCANTVSEARVSLRSKPASSQTTTSQSDGSQVSNCSDRNKQAWCVEADTSELEHLRLKLFFLDLKSVPRNHIRYISWIAYVVRRDPKSGAQRESIVVRNSPHSSYYQQDGMDMGTIMDTEIEVKELNESPQTYLDSNHLTVHIEWVDSLLLFSHLYNNYDSLATVQRHQIRRELSALQLEYAQLERKYGQSRRTLKRLLVAPDGRFSSPQHQRLPQALLSPATDGGEQAHEISEQLGLAGLQDGQLEPLERREQNSAGDGPHLRLRRLGGRRRLLLGVDDEDGEPGEVDAEEDELEDELIDEEEEEPDEELDEEEEEECSSSGGSGPRYFNQTGVTGSQRLVQQMSALQLTNEGQQRPMSMNIKRASRAGSLQLDGFSQFHPQEHAHVGFHPPPVGKPAPMAFDERLQLSSSTPPSGRHLPLDSAALGASGRLRRQLPQQPGGQAARMRHGGGHAFEQQQQIERRNSIISIRDSTHLLSGQFGQPAGNSSGLPLGSQAEANFSLASEGPQLVARPLNILLAGQQSSLRNQLETQSTDELLLERPFQQSHQMGHQNIHLQQLHHHSLAGNQFHLPYPQAATSVAVGASTANSSPPAADELLAAMRAPAIKRNHRSPNVQMAQVSSDKVAHLNAGQLYKAPTSTEQHQDNVEQQPQNFNTNANLQLHLSASKQVEPLASYEIAPVLYEQANQLSAVYSGQPIATGQHHLINTPGQSQNNQLYDQFNRL